MSDAPKTIWAFCPECGSKKAHHATITHRVCNDCGQDWHTDLDYTSVCQSNLRRYATRTDSAPAPAGVTVQEAMRDGIVKGMHIALTTPIEEVSEAIAAALRALSGDRT